MHLKRLPFTLGIAIGLVVLAAQRLTTPILVRSATTHPVISEIQIGGTSDADDEFVELYNPTGADVDLTGWRLSRKTPTGTTQNSLVSNISGTIKAHGFFLITSPESLSSGSADFIYDTTSHLAASNSATLYSDGGITVIDIVGMGSSVVSESATISNPPVGGSIERKPGESDPLAGNGIDTDNNSNDFAIRTISEPQNSSSAIEAPIEPTLTLTTTPTSTESPSQTPTETPTETPTPTPTSEPTETPTVTPTLTETPTQTPSPTETTEPTHTPTESPSQTPTETPIPSLTPTLTPSATPTNTPTATPSPSPTKSPFSLRAFNNALFFCNATTFSINILGRTWLFPMYSCSLR